MEEEKPTSSDQSGEETPEKPAAEPAKPRKKFEETAKTRLARKTGKKSGHANHAYTLLEDPNKPGHYFAVHLEEVTYREAAVLEPNECSESLMRGLARCENAMRIRSRRGSWGPKPKVVVPIAHPGAPRRRSKKK